MVDRVDGVVLWANLHLLLWLVAVPVHDRVDGRERISPAPRRSSTGSTCSGPPSRSRPAAGIERRPDGRRLRAALGRDVKGKLSPVLYLLGIGLAFIEPWLGVVPFVVVAAMWLVPDRRVERYLERERGTVD